MEILWCQSEMDNCLAPSCLADLENVRNDFGVARSTVLRIHAAFMQALSHNARLQAEMRLFSSALTSARTLQEETNSYRQRLVDSTAEVEHLCGFFDVSA